MKLSELAARLTGMGPREQQIECTVEGDGNIDITGVAAIEDAGAGELTFFANPKYAGALKRTRASAVIASPTARDPMRGPSNRGAVSDIRAGARTFC